MSRRGFVAALTGIAAVSALPVVAKAESPDLFHRGEWTIAWHGWRSSPNQMVAFGIWTASRHGQEEFKYSTTGGIVNDAHDFEVLDLSFQRGWPRLTAMMEANDPDHYRAMCVQAKANALRSLLEALRG